VNLDPEPDPWTQRGPKRFVTNARALGLPFFFKQLGGRTPKANGRQLDGRVWNELPHAATSGLEAPNDLRVQLAL
jgi:protein gp37